MTAASATALTQLEEDGAAWATAMSRTLTDRGVPRRAVDEASSTQIIAARSEIIFDIAAPRRLLFAEIFAGSAKLAQNVRTTYSLNAVAFDRCFEGEIYDACNLSGVLFLAFIFSSMLRGGVVHFSPECWSEVRDVGVSTLGAQFQVK